MTLRKASADAALRAFRGATAKLDLQPIQGAWVHRGPPGDEIHGVALRDSIFCSPWWGHCSGSSIATTFDPVTSLVGAYGELVESLSCDLWYPDWLPSHRVVAPLWDEQRVSGDVCADRLPRRSGVRRCVEAAPTSSEYRVHAYARVDDPEDTILFPREIGLEVCGRNNGAGVGSEPAEAVVTGLLEIFERYAVEKFALGTERFPLIDPKVLANARAGRIADFLTSQGCETHFVDMSLGGHLPVVGVLLIRPRSDAMSIAVAGSHNLEEAVEHGLREALSDDFYRDRLIGWPETRKEDDRARAWSRSGFTLGWGGSLDFIDFARGYSRAYEAAFDATVADNQALLRRCLTIARGFGSEVYARDCSVLGVPAFHVYASVLSDNMFVAHEGLMSEARNAALLNAISRDRWLRDYLPVLDQCHSGTFDNWRTLYALLDNPFVGFPDDEDVCDYFGWPVTTPEGSSPLASDRRGVALSTLVAGLAYHAGEYATALALWRQPKSLRGPDHEIVAHYLELTAKLGTLPAAKEVFGAALGASRLADVERALSVESLVRLPTGEGDPAVVETTKRWSHLRKMIYPGAGQWRAKPFELGLG